MTEYVIKHYHDGFEVDQEKIGNEVAKSFIAPHQTPADRLKEAYSREDFDPETRLYAFKDDKMVGFLTARVLPEEEDGIKKASLTPPSVLAEHEVATELLFNKAIKILKKKGVQKIQSNFGAYSSKQEETAKEWGYKFINRNNFIYKINLDGIDFSKVPEEIIDIDFDKHQKDLAKILVAEYGRDEEFVNTFIDRIKNDPNNKRINKVILEGDEVKAYLGLNPNDIDSSIARVIAVYASNEDYMKKMLIMAAKIAKDKKLKQLQTGFTEEDDIKLKKYFPIKFELVGTSSQFEKEL